MAQQTNFIAQGPQGSEPEFVIVKNYELQFTWIADKIKKLVSTENIQLRETGVILYDGLKETNIKIEAKLFLVSQDISIPMLNMSNRIKL